MLKYTRAVCNRLIHNIQKSARVCWMLTQLLGISIPLVQLFTRPDIFLYNLILACTLLAFFIFTLIVDKNTGNVAKKKAKKQKQLFKKIVDIIKTLSKLLILFTVGFGIYCIDPTPSLLALLPIIFTTFGIFLSLLCALISHIITTEVTLLVDAIQEDASGILEPARQVRNYLNKVAGHFEDIEDTPAVSEESRERLNRILKQFQSEQEQKKEEKKKKRREFAHDLFHGFLRMLIPKKKSPEEHPARAPLETETPPPIPEEGISVQPPAPLKKKKSFFPFIKRKTKKKTEEETAPEEALPKV